jgi:hypothetical protein
MVAEIIAFLRGSKVTKDCGRGEWLMIKLQQKEAARRHDIVRRGRQAVRIRSSKGRR